ncbi:MAG: hypothetical protein IPQ07_05435 [Myxococcales bacterium]|nr:hypothetical protein [Myxococcales bacterium]
MKKLLMFATAGLLAPAAANAEVGTAKVVVMQESPVTDKAPVSGTPARLRRTDSEQAGAEMAHIGMFADGKTGLYVVMSTELKGVAATHRVQCAVTPFALTQGTDGSVTAAPDMALARYVTNNDGDEYRNCHHPSMTPIADGELMLLRYNYQPQGANNTKVYAQVINKRGETVAQQTEIMAKNNDNCSMQQDSNNGLAVKLSATKTRFVETEGCNGNGADDGWLNIVDVDCPTAAACTIRKVADLSVVPREERSRAGVSIGKDPNTAIMTWTEGNNQPQRDGTWMAAIDIGTAGQNGANAQSRLLWKKQIDGRKTVEGITTYSMRAKQARIQELDASGKLVNTDMIIWQSGDLRGNNNTNNGKGGTYYGNQMAVIEATATGMKYITPMHDVAADLVGLDGTHLGMQFAMFGTTDALKPGLVMVSGSQTGGGSQAQLRAVTWDKTTGVFADAGSFGGAPYDRHLYSNYLGNNPGNQGRNFSDVHLLANPYVGMNGSKDAYLMLISSTGKSPADMTDPAKKLTAYLSVIPVASTPIVVPPTGGGSGSGSGTPDPTNPDGNTGGTDSGTSLGGCSATTGTSGALTFLLIGLAAFIRRRR